MSFWNQCSHNGHSEPDSNGDAICNDCGALLRGVVLTKSLLVETFERIRRSYGYRSHSMACVDTPDGWCCAQDCTMSVRAHKA